MTKNGVKLSFSLYLSSFISIRCIANVYIYHLLRIVREILPNILKLSPFKTVIPAPQKSETAILPYLKN
jgi:hypothetical protein